MPGADAVLRHNALVYDSEEEYLATAVAFLREGLEQGEGAVVANTRPGLHAMRDALGDHAASVRFVDVSEAYTRPAKTLAAYHEVYAQELGRAPTLRAVADVQFGPVPGEWDLWTGYEAVFNRSFAHLPAWVLCSYRAGSLPPAVREGVWRTHPHVVSGGVWNDSASYDELNKPWRPEGTPGALAESQTLDLADDLDVVRERLVSTMHRHGLPADRILDMVLASTEVLTNAVTHGAGVRSVRTGRVGGRYACEVVDHGSGFDDPWAGYLAPVRGRGSGLWVARQLSWDLDFFWSPDGFTARITA
ncbi:MAG: sensor histidine kinase [Nocardioides sp.]